jgi:protein SCO1/2
MLLRRAWLIALLGLAACAEGSSPVVAGAGSSGPSTDPTASDPADFGALPDFRLVSQAGQEVTLADLRGHPLVIAALYSTCNGPCPSIADALRRLQRDLADTDVRLVTVSVNPTVDTPEVLARYAAAKGADPERWTFLTGDEAEVQRLVREGFFLAVERSAPAELLEGADEVTHDTRLLVVDRDGHRRGWYQGTDEGQLARLRGRVRFLAGEGE